MAGHGNLARFGLAAALASSYAKDPYNLANKQRHYYPDGQEYKGNHMIPLLIQHLLGLAHAEHGNYAGVGPGNSGGTGNLYGSPPARYLNERPDGTSSGATSLPYSRDYVVQLINALNAKGGPQPYK